MLYRTAHRKMHADLFPPSKLHVQLSYSTKSEQKKSLVTSQSIEVDFTCSHTIMGTGHKITDYCVGFIYSILISEIKFEWFNSSKSHHCVRLRLRGLLPEVCCTKVMDLRLNPSKQLCQNRSNCNFYHPRM